MNLHSFDSSHPVALWIMVPSLCIWIALEIRQGFTRRPEGVRSKRGSPIFIRIAVIIGLGISLLLNHADPNTHMWSGAGWIALGTLECGIALRLWSFQTLGRYFTFTVQTSADQPVITAGPYSVIRHPGYAGIILAYLSVLIIASNWWFVLGVGSGLLAALVFRITIEERALLSELGAPYREYSATHKRLVPFVW
jgi:protein-S-isoprenylcysteine O-methyltransferase Ste14